MKLFLVPTPVGNLGDMTYRAVEVLKGADLILAEDTRTSRVVMQHYGIDTPLHSYHIFNEHQTLHSVIDRLLSGQTIALVTDAGTPGISDPGFLLVREAVCNGIEVETLPGATAFVPALVDSGLPCDRFVFLGFLPHKKGRQTAIRQLAEEQRTMVIYESPYRLVKLLEELMNVMGESRPVSVSREISKLHAETVRGTLQEVHHHFASKEVKGEIVVVVSGQGNDTPQEEEKVCNKE
ncbi:MAG: 16S rRNA (cytidine(1402)-2'-O)-methyltransferase [Bacteroidales bacterium]|nr:16S rRNA (cytidine(1402)-2'-O)-methyltransferase [Bacteroidales bacterium]